jgi:hypothetical protein
LDGDAGHLLDVFHPAKMLVHDRDPIGPVAIKGGREAFPRVHPPSIVTLA